MKSCKEYYNETVEKIKNEISVLSLKPRFTIIQVGNDEASNRYVKNKIKDCEFVGIKVSTYKFDESVRERDLLYRIYDLSEKCDGLIVQLPLPKHISEARVKNAIPKDVDIDGFNGGCDPCTPKGVVDWLEWNNFIFSGKNAVVVGRSDLVGKPLAKMLLDRDMTVTICHSKTRDIKKLLCSADLVVSAVGVPNLIHSDMVNPDSIVIDVGINFVNGKMVGDCKSSLHCKYQTTVPGGVGLLTRASMMKNILELSYLNRID